MKIAFHRLRKITIAVLGTIGVATGFAIFSPAVLAFPHRTQIGEITVYSVERPGPELAGVIARATALSDASEIATPLGPRSIFLTDGGWRWRILSLPSYDGVFALTRPFSTNIVLNRSEIARDAVHNGGTVARRTLTGTIAHETAHLQIYRRYGMLQAVRFARWKVEGFADHVARESGLTPELAERLRREGQTPPALMYFDGRKKVEAALAAGTSVDALMRGK